MSKFAVGERVNNPADGQEGCTIIAVFRIPPLKLSITHISGHAKFKTDLDIC